MSGAAKGRRVPLGRPLIILLLAMALLMPTTAAAQTYEAGLAAFNRAQYEAAEAAWLPLAESGDLRSQYALAVLYEKRAGRDPALIGQAAEWYRRAAEQGHPGAQTNYASLLARGHGVAEDQKLAVYYWQLAARQDNVLAQYNLGLAYYRGEGVVPDARRALAWFRRAADAGMADAQFAMGQMNALGVGAARNSGRALTWFSMAEKQGHVDAGRQADRLRSEGVAAEQPGAPLPLPGDGEAVAAAPAPEGQDAEPTESASASQPASSTIGSAAYLTSYLLARPSSPSSPAGSKEIVTESRPASTTNMFLASPGGRESFSIALATLSRPPVRVLPLRADTSSTVFSSLALICAAVASGKADLTNAAAPATCGVAIDVPLSSE